MVKLQPWRAIKALFGYSSTGQQKAVVTPRSLKHLAMNVYSYGKDPLSTWYARKTQLTQDRLQAYKEFDDLDSCLVGETQVVMANGTEVPIKDLVGREPFWVYSYDQETGMIVPGKGKAKKTRPNAQLVQVVLDNDQSVKCTPDHPWMLRDGSYREAKDLKAGDSLMPLYRRVDTTGIPGYEMLMQPNKQRWYHTHRQFAPLHIPRGCRIVHHKNYNKRDNSPDNLQWMTKGAHTELHTVRDPVVEKRRVANLRKALAAYHSDPTRHAEHHQMCLDSRTPEVIEQIRAQDLKVWSNPETHAVRLAEVRKGIADYHADPVKHEAHRRLCAEPFKDPAVREFRIGRMQEGRRAYLEKRRGENAQLQAVANHKVVSVIQLAEREDCYDLVVEKHHNFALSVGVFVHNSDMITSALDLFGEDAMPPCPVTSRRIWIEAEDEEIEKMCNDMFTRINADEQSFSIARELAKYGNSFSGLIQEEKSDGTPGQVIQILPSPVYALSRIEDQEGRLIGFAVAPIEQMGSVVGLAQPTDLTQGNPTDPPWAFVHWRLLGKERMESYGTSLLWGARAPWRRLAMAEDALVMYRLRRSPDRFVFSLHGMTGLSPEDRARAMRQIRQELRKKHIIDQQTGQVRSELEPLGPDEDIIVDEESVTVSRLTGSVQVNHVFDIEYLRKRFFGALKIPSDYMGFSDAKSGFISDSPLSYQDINFARVTKRLQYSTLQGFALVAQINMCWCGVDPRSVKAKFTVHGNPVSLLDEKNRLELEKVRAETLDNLQKIGSDLGLDGEEWHAYLLQRSQIPMHLLRKTGKEKSTIIKGKVRVDEPGMGRIGESLKKKPELNEAFNNLLTRAYKVKVYLVRRLGEGKAVEIEEKETALTLRQLYSPEQGANFVSSETVINSLDTNHIPLRVTDANKALTESVAVIKWKSAENRVAVEKAKNIMTETIKKLKEEQKAGVVKANNNEKIEELKLKYNIPDDEFDEFELDEEDEADEKDDN